MLIVVLGLPRSGTTLLGRVLAGAEGICYEEEPNVIWRYRNYALLGHDQFAEQHATDEVRRYVRGYFMRRLRRSGARCLVEKTPANVLRPEFVLRILPEARLIVVNRSLDEIRRSLYRRIVCGEDRNAERLGESSFLRVARLKAKRLAKVPFPDLPGYVPQIASDITGGRLFPRHRFWGPRQKGWETTLELPIGERIERQCAAMTDSLESFLARTDREVLRLSYESLCAEPDSMLGDVEEYLGFRCGSLDRSRVQSR